MIDNMFLGPAFPKVFVESTTVSPRLLESAFHGVFWKDVSSHLNLSLLVGPEGDLPQHLQVMINLLRCEDKIKLVRAEGMALSGRSLLYQDTFSHAVDQNQGTGVLLCGRYITGMCDTFAFMPGSLKGPEEMGCQVSVAPLLDMNVA